ncbi:radical SAM/SPASM domain-containing protein [Nocardia pneumoniae]|uniref:radical SAM/SPASM domain-containing protein n=1 Tax=Nocardia pneumoniae TaxID=228601 RepID=UPI00146138A3|nr:radical SAM protein [Nocardia pneumoniae]
MTSAIVDERAQRLTARLVLVGDDVLHDQVSGRKMVINKTSRVFWRVLSEHGTGAAAAAVIAKRFGIPQARAAADFEAFVAELDQGQRCAGSILPGRDHAVLEPTAACNGQCPHCYHGTRSERWPAEQIPEILARVRAEGLRSVSVTGGEVFSAHFINQFFDLAATLRDEGIELASVSTNATFLTEDIRDRILRDVAPTTVFRISLDALRSDLLDRIRPGYRNLTDPYAPIRDLAAAGYPLVFTTNLWSQPLGEVVEIGEYLRQYSRVQAWNVRLAVPVHHGGGDRTRTAARKRQLFGLRPDVRLPLRHYAAILSRHADDRFSFPVRMGNYLATSLLEHPQALTAMAPGHPCREDEHLVTVKASGQITQCPILTELAPELNAGSVLDDTADGFTDRLPLAGLHTDTMACSSCPVRPVCGGGCRLYSMAYDGGLSGCDEPARALLSWILADPTGILRAHWPGYHARMRELVGDADIQALYGQHAAGWDR